MKTKSLVKESRKNPAKPRISADLVRSVGLDMISASAGTNEKLAAEAWGAAIELLNYRSTLNAEVSPLPPIGHPRVINEFSFSIKFADTAGLSPGDDLSRNLRTFGDDVPIDQAARLEDLGSTANSGRTMGPRVVVMAFPDKSVNIDGSWYKNVVVSNTKIEYSGGPVKLENVYFINCEFRMRNLAPARALGDQMISAASVSFDGTLLPQPTTGRSYPTKPANTNFHAQSAILALTH